MRKILGLLSNSAFFTFATFIEASAPLLLAPLLTRYLMVYEYGLWGIFQSISGLLRPIMSLGLDDYIRIHFHLNDRQTIIQLMRLVFRISILIMCGVLALMFLLDKKLAHILYFPREYLWIIIVCAWEYAIFYLLLTYHQFDEQKGIYVLTQLTQAVVTLGGTVILVLLGYGWLGAVAGKILGLLTGCSVAVYFILSGIDSSRHIRMFNRECRDLLSFGLRYLPITLLPMLTIAMDRIMLAHMISIESSSNYVVASLIPAAFLVGVQGMLLAWQPWCFSRLAQRFTPLKEIALGGLLFTLLMPMGGLILFYIAKWGGPWMIGPKFQMALHYKTILIIAAVVQGYFLIAQSVLHYYKKLSYLGFISCMALVVKLALNLIFIPAYGINGVGLSTVIAYFLGFVVIIIADWRTVKDCSTPL